MQSFAARHGHRILLGLGGVIVSTTALTGSALCQSGPVQHSHDAHIREQQEDRVAQMFESIRQGSGLPRLTRIRHRHDLEQLVCTAAIRHASPWAHNWPALLMYRTADPQSPADDLKAIANFKDIEENPIPPWTRYAIAVWPTEDRSAWWVGAGIYWSAMSEWFDNNLTDNKPYRNQWKDLVAPGCRSIK